MVRSQHLGGCCCRDTHLHTWAWGQVWGRWPGCIACCYVQNSAVPGTRQDRGLRGLLEPCPAPGRQVWGPWGGGSAISLGIWHMESLWGDGRDAPQPSFRGSIAVVPREPLARPEPHVGGLLKAVGRCDSTWSPCLPRSRLCRGVCSSITGWGRGAPARRPPAPALPAPRRRVSMKAGGPFPHPPPPPPSPTGSCQSAASSSRKSREPPCEPGRATTAPAPQAPRTGGTAPLPTPPALAGVPPRRGQGRVTTDGGAPSYSPGAGPTPPGMSSACWWAQRGVSSLGAVMGSRGVTPHLGVSLWTASCFVFPPPSRPRLAAAPGQGGHEAAVQCSCPPPLPPLPRRGWVAHPEPAPPSPFPSPDCLSEYRKNKLCRWPPASQKHLMSRSAQAALQGCINLEEFPAWELLLGGGLAAPLPSCALPEG